MRPSSRYWVWNVRIGLVVVLGLFLVFVRVTRDSHLTRGNLVGWFLFFAVCWFLASSALWLFLFVSEAETWPWFAAWFLLGLAAAGAAITLGPIVLLPAVAVTALLAYRRGFRRSVDGLLSGLGCLLILSMVWENAHTPYGCQPIPHVPNGCEIPNHAAFGPPFLFGVALLITGVVAQAWRQKRKPASRAGHLTRSSAGG